MTTLRIYTDGACSGNQEAENLGGWGAILEYGTHVKELHGGERNTTNNRMEMTALLRALEALTKEGQTIEVFSDSAYLTNCFRNSWYVSWKRNDWKNAKKEPVKNRDLWEALLPYLKKHNLRFYRVKGHVHLDTPAANTAQLLRQFRSWNGSRFTEEDFRHATERNNRADALANEGVAELRLR